MKTVLHTTRCQQRKEDSMDRVKQEKKLQKLAIEAEKRKPASKKEESE